MAGHDIVVAQLVAAGAEDRDLAALAIAENRIVVSEDYDFGDLAVRDGVAIPGVVLVAIGTPVVAERAARLAAAIADLGDRLIDHVTVVETMRVRRRRLR